MIACDDKFQAESRAFDLSNRDRDLFFYVGYTNAGRYYVDPIGIVPHGHTLIEIYHQTKCTRIGR